MMGGKSKVRGFTLVELAIVLVIIGIIIGAVLKSNEMIFNAKVKRTINQVRELTAAFYAYYDKYGYYPGDDPTASSRWPGAPNGNGDGRIDIGHGCIIDYTNLQFEIQFLRTHLRYANLVTGNPTFTDSSEIPRNAFGGTMCISSGRQDWPAPFDDPAKLWVHLSRIGKTAAEAIDRALDDGKCNSGIVRAFHFNCDGEQYKDIFLSLFIKI